MIRSEMVTQSARLSKKSPPELKDTVQPFRLQNPFAKGYNSSSLALQLPSKAPTSSNLYIIGAL